MRIPVKETKYRLTVYGEAANKTIDYLEPPDAVSQIHSRFPSARYVHGRDPFGNPVMSAHDGEKLVALVELQQDQLLAA